MEIIIIRNKYSDYNYFLIVITVIGLAFLRAHDGVSSNDAAVNIGASEESAREEDRSSNVRPVNWKSRDIIRATMPFSSPTAVLATVVGAGSAKGRVARPSARLSIHFGAASLAPPAKLPKSRPGRGSPEMSCFLDQVTARHYLIRRGGATS